MIQGNNNVPGKNRSISSEIRRAVVGHFPTPIEKLSGTFPACDKSNVYIKRDDCTGLGLGGNKTRKLEYLIADAMKRGCSTIFTTGGIQSNHARQTAAAAAKFNLACELFLTPVAGTPEKNYNDNGNVLLNELFDAKIVICKDDESVETCMKERAQEIGADNVYTVPIGGSNPVGTLGYIRCAQEILEQSQQSGILFDAIVVATGSCGTQAGLLAGLEIAGAEVPVYGYCVSRDGEEQERMVMALLERCSQEIGTPPVVASKVHCNGNYYYPSYGVPNDLTRQAISKLAQQDAILLDPVYTGKAMAGLLDQYGKGTFADNKNILFLHTGGQASLFAYADQFSL